jgi:(p)ppGpp synthase/HD superfamily hydrolase
MCLFAGRFRPSGKTFIAHLVGTASILSSLRVPIEVVAAGLLHAAYIYGDFGDEDRGISEAKREQLRGVVGRRIEEYVDRYTIQPWNEKTISAICDSLDALSPIDRDVLLMRLANELEDHLDLGILYCGNVKQRQHYINRSGAILVKIAEELGFPTLAADLAQIFRESTLAEIPAQLRRPSNSSFTLAPSYYQRRLLVVFRHRLVYRLRCLHSAVHQFKQKLMT